MPFWRHSRGKTVDKRLCAGGLKGRPDSQHRARGKKQGSRILYSDKESLNRMSEDGKHQGVIAMVASYAYAELGDILSRAREKGEDPFLILLDGIEDPYNLGAIIRTANQVGAHGVVINKNRAVGLTASVARTSAGALNYTPVAKVTNMARTIEELKKEGLWFVAADMDRRGDVSHEPKGAAWPCDRQRGQGAFSELVRKKCDFTARIPMLGQIDSLNASVAAGVLAYEVLRQRRSS